MDTFEKFSLRLLDLDLDKNEQALAFLWFHQRSTGEAEASFEQLSALFDAASLPKLRKDRFSEFARKSRRVNRGSKKGIYRLAPDTISEYEAAFDQVFQLPPEPEITERAGIRNTPLLSTHEIDSARKMAELYVILHCYENSARKLIEKVLSTSIGTNWWDVAANTQMKQKYRDRQLKEQKNKWITPRGATPLYYMDWGDLISLIRRNEAEFMPWIGDLKFIELRMEELERVRNIIAHNGVLAAQDDFDRLVLSFKDWCKQVKL